MLHIDNAFALSAFTASTTFLSIALASAALPYGDCRAKAADDIMRTVAAMAQIIALRIIYFLLVELAQVCVLFAGTVMGTGMLVIRVPQN